MNLTRLSGLTILILLTNVFAVQSQQSGQLNREATDRTRVQAIDELGLRIALENVEQEGSIDPQTYIVGVNDIFSVEVKGAVSFTYRGVVVNPLGDIVIPEIATIRVADLKLSDAIRTIQRAVSQRFRDGEVSVSLELARPVNVHLTGSIPVPGRATLPRGTRLDLLVTYGILPEALSPELMLNRPVTKITRLLESDFDLRNIRVTRKDGTVIMADLIGYNLGGQLDQNPFLEDGDIINIRRRTDSEYRVSVSGAVGLRLDIPFRAGDTAWNLIELSGGIATEALDNTVHVIRLENSRFTTHRLDYENARSFEMQPSDRIVIPVDSEKRRQRSIRMRGEVMYPGTYPVISGVTTLREVLEMSGGLTNEANNRVVKLQRTGEEKWDDRNREPLIPDQFNELREFNIGAINWRFVRTSDQFREGIDFLLSELDLDLTLIYIDLENEDHLDNIILFGNDKISVMRDENTVLMMGQVQHPGYLPFRGGQSAEDYLQLAGGLSAAADHDRVFVIKKGTNAWYRPDETTISSGDIIYVDRIPPEDYQAFRLYDIQRQQLRNNNIQIVLSTVSTIVAIVTTYLFIVRD